MPAGQRVQCVLDLRDLGSALTARGIESDRDREVEVLAQAVEAGMNLRQARPALEHQSVDPRELLEDECAEVVLLDQTGIESGARGGEPDDLDERSAIEVGARRRRFNHGRSTRSPSGDRLDPAWAVSGSRESNWQ